MLTNFFKERNKKSNNIINQLTEPEVIKNKNKKSIADIMNKILFLAELDLQEGGKVQLKSKIYMSDPHS